MLFSAAALTLLAHPRAPMDDPFPVDTTTIKTAGRVYAVEGRRVINRKSSVAALRAIKIRGSKGGGSVLEVRGSLKLKAATGGRIVLEDVWLEVAPECQNLVLSQCEFRGRGGLRVTERGPTSARVFLEYVDIKRPAVAKLDMTGGELQLRACRSDEPVAIRGLPRSATSPCELRAIVASCSGVGRGLMGGLVLEGAKTATVRNSDLAGPKSVFADNGRLQFDGNNARSRALVFRTSKPRSLANTQISNSDFRSRVVTFTSTKAAGGDVLVLENNWFDGLTDRKKIQTEMIEDGRDDPSAGVRTELQGIRNSPAGLGGSEGNY